MTTQPAYPSLTETKFAHRAINDSDTKMEIISDTNLELSVSIVSSTKFNNKLVTRTTLRLDIVDTEITHRFFRILTNDHISKPAYSINVCE